MRLEFATRALAQSKADAIHARMISTDPEYAESVRTGQTLRWAVPYQDLDAGGNPINTLWYINLKERTDKVLSGAERAALKAFSL